MAEQHTTRDLWAAEGPFTHYEVQRSRERNVHADYEKAARFDTINGDLGYHAKSNIVDEEGNEERYFAVEFNPARICWTEIRWIENLREGGYWEAFRIAASDLGLDITVEEATSAQDRAEAAARAQRITDFRDSTLANDDTPSRASSPGSTTSSRPSIIRIRESPAVAQIAQLAESLQIQDNTMSQVMTTTAVAVGNINPVTGHMYTAEDVAIYRAVGPDRGDPPPFQGRGFPMRPPGGGSPGGGGPPEAEDPRRRRTTRRRRATRRRRICRTSVPTNHTTRRAKRQVGGKSTRTLHWGSNEVRRLHDPVEIISTNQRRESTNGYPLSTSYVVPHLYTGRRYN